MDKQVYHYLKAYIRSDDIKERSQLLQVQYQGSTYRFSIERLVYRSFYQNEYKMYSNQKSIFSNQYRMILYIQGENIIIFEGKKLKCKEGTLLLLSPGKQPSITPKARGECNIIVFNFDLVNNDNEYLHLSWNELMELYAGIQCKKKSIFSIGKHQKDKLKSILDQLYEVVKNQNVFVTENTGGFAKNPGGLFEGTGLILKIFSFLIKEAYKSQYENPVHGYRPVNKARELIEHNYNQKLTIDELARTACLSRTHFQYLFKKTFGVTPIQYQLHLRINTAKDLLAGTSLSCKEIAYKTGFKSTYYFSRQFKNLTGFTPSEYRNKFKL